MIAWIKRRHSNWTNRDNIDFYRKLPAGFLRKVSAYAGLENVEDLERLRGRLLHGLSPSPHILEIGAGEGRVIDWCLQTFKQSRVTALEHCPELAATLQATYKFEPRVEILQASLLDALTLARKPDLITWMWSSLLELNPSEQRAALMVLRSLMSVRTRLIIDINIETDPEQCGYIDGVALFGTVHYYQLTLTELEQLVTKAGLKIAHAETYVTASGSPRRTMMLRI